MPSALEAVPQSLFKKGVILLPIRYSIATKLKGISQRHAASFFYDDILYSLAYSRQNNCGYKTYCDTVSAVGVTGVVIETK